MTNIEIREAAQNSSVCLWEIAEKFGIADSNFSRKLRREFSEDDKQKALNAINEIVKERSND